MESTETSILGVYLYKLGDSFTPNDSMESTETFFSVKKNWRNNFVSPPTTRWRVLKHFLGIVL